MAKAAKRLRIAPATRVLYVRHARAHERGSWQGDDNLRPLDKKGRRQAEMLVPMLSAYQPTAIYSALPQRCQQTAAPLADELGKDISINKNFGDEAWENDPEAAKKAFRRVVNDVGSEMCIRVRALSSTVACPSASAKVKPFPALLRTSPQSSSKSRWTS